MKSIMIAQIDQSIFVGQISYKKKKKHKQSKHFTTEVSIMN